MGFRARFGSERSSVERPSYQLGRRMESLIKPGITDHRIFLALRNAGRSVRYSAFGSRAGRSELRGEPLGDEGWEE